MLFPLLLLSTVTAFGGVAAADSAASPSLTEFASAWSKIDAYSVTVDVHETAGKTVQDRTYAFAFQKPSNATIVITKGSGRGGKVVWTGGDSVVGSPPGLFSGMKVHVGIADTRVTSLRGDTVAMASFAWILDHFQQTAGVKTEAPGAPVNGNATTEISLAVADPASDAGLTQEVLVISNATELPVSGRGYVGADLVKDVHFSGVTVQSPGSQAVSSIPSRAP